MNNTENINQAAFAAVCKERDDMRKAIQQAATAIGRLATAAAGGMQPANAKQDAIRFGNAVLTELQSFTTP